MSEFENDVKTYGTQAVRLRTRWNDVFENDVKTYGIMKEASVPTNAGSGASFAGK